MTARSNSDPSPTAALISSSVSPTTIPTSRIPAAAMASSAKNSTGRFATGTSCFAEVWVIGRSRVPAPPASTSAFTRVSLRLAAAAPPT